MGLRYPSSHQVHCRTAYALDARRLQTSKQYVPPYHPADKTDKYFACQSLDNQILIYAADGSFKQAKKKRFAGHTIAGYACNIGFSPDGKYISSGTGGGDVVFWDWKTGKIASRLRAHKEVVIDHAWLPNEHVSFCRFRILRAS
jgi:WD40 repeat protein